MSPPRLASWHHGPPAAEIMAYNKDKVHTYSHMIRKWEMVTWLTSIHKKQSPFLVLVQRITRSGPSPTTISLLGPQLRRTWKGVVCPLCNTSLFPGSYYFLHCDESTYLITSKSHFMFKNNWFIQLKAFLHEVVPNCKKTAGLFPLCKKLLLYIKIWFFTAL